jgi:hypothetical protein
MWPVMGFKILILIFSFTLILASFSFSQPSGIGMRKGKGEGSCWRASDLNLSQEQVKGLELIQQTYLRETQLLRFRLAIRRLEFRELLTNPTTSTESIRGRYLEIIELQSKQEEKVLEYLIKVRGLLTSEQLKIWCPEQEFPHFRMMIQRMGPMGPMAPKITPPAQERYREE